MPIRQSIIIKCSPEKLYGAMMSEAEFGQATGAPADIISEEGGAFSCFGGQITGRQIELKANKRIVQAWRVGSWPEGVYSIVKFDIDRSNGSTMVTMDQSGFPDDAESHLEAGWHKMYWTPLRTHLEAA